jgi:peroxiredoxin (alkyl hydroperoxide reductase subunit C)
MTITKVGDPAPDFDLPAYDPLDPGNLKLRVTLAHYSGEWLVLFFYPSDFTFVCPTEILAFADHRKRFDDLGAKILGCSTDTIHTHRAWVETPRDKNGIAGVNFPLAADHAGRLAESFGILLPDQHVALRGLFIIGPTGRLEYSVIHSLNIGRSTEETHRVLAALQTGGLCPSDWKPGGKTLLVPLERKRAA